MRREVEQNPPCLEMSVFSLPEQHGFNHKDPFIHLKYKLTAVQRVLLHATTVSETQTSNAGHKHVDSSP